LYRLLTFREVRVRVRVRTRKGLIGLGYVKG
jgi:hypothetical protein